MIILHLISLGTGLGTVLVGMFTATPTVAGGCATAFLLWIAGGAVELVRQRCMLYLRLHVRAESTEERERRAEMLGTPDMSVTFCCVDICFAAGSNAQCCTTCVMCQHDQYAACRLADESQLVAPF